MSQVRLGGTVIEILIAAFVLSTTAMGLPIRTFKYSDIGVDSVAFSPDGTKVLIGSYYPESTTTLWEVATGAELLAITGNLSQRSPVAFSPDGAKILTASGCDVYSAKLWSATTGAELLTFTGHVGGILSVAFSPDGTKVLTGSDDHTAKLWDAATGVVIQTLTGHTSFVWSVAISPDGTKLLTGSHDGTAKLWDAATGMSTRTLTGQTSGVTSVAFSPDGTKVLTGSGNTAKLWDAVTGVVIQTFTGHTSFVDSVAFSPDGTKVLTGSDDGTAKLWGAVTGALILTFSGHMYCVTSVAFSPDGTKVLTGSSDCTAKLWDTTIPTMTINQATTQNDPTNTSPINFTVVFSEAVNPSTFTGADVVITGTTGGTKTVKLTTTDNIAWNAAVSGMTTIGTVIADIPIGAVIDVWGNANSAASTKTDNTVTVTFPLEPRLPLLGSLGLGALAAALGLGGAIMHRRRQ